MAQLVEVKVPDIGDFKDVAVIELMVQVGETIAVETGLMMVESDKASMEIPSTHAGVVKEIKVKVNDKVSEGSVILVRRGGWSAAAAPAAGACSAGQGRDACSRRRPRRSPTPRPTPARPTSNAKCWCSAPAPAATRPPSAAPTSA